MICSYLSCLSLSCLLLAKQVAATESTYYHPTSITTHSLPTSSMVTTSSNVVSLVSTDIDGCSRRPLTTSSVVTNTPVEEDGPEDYEEGTERRVVTVEQGVMTTKARPSFFGNNVNILLGLK